jgi:hypothetical protein
MTALETSSSVLFLNVISGFLIFFSLRFFHNIKSTTIYLALKALLLLLLFSFIISHKLYNKFKLCYSRVARIWLDTRFGLGC